MIRYVHRRAAAAQDVALVVAFVVVAIVGGGTPLARVLLGAIVVVLAGGLATLHYPHLVVLDDAGVRFEAYGRAHAFAWRDVTRVRVRRFLVRDRVLVRLAPAPPWRGRYWLVDGRGAEGFAETVRALEARARAEP